MCVFGGSELGEGIFFDEKIQLKCVQQEEENKSILMIMMMMIKNIAGGVFVSFSICL